MIPSKTRILPPRERKKISQRKLFVGICCQFIVRQKWTLHVIKQTIVVGRIKLTLLATVDVQFISVARYAHDAIKLRICGPCELALYKCP